MNQALRILNARIVNEGEIREGDIQIENGRITKIGQIVGNSREKVIDARGKYVLPGVIDDQVHFREPGLTQKAEIATEARAAVAGGVTSYMEMPNTKPQALTQKLLEAKYQRAAEVSPANYSFFMGASNDNLMEVLSTNPRTVCGIKIFMGSSTGNMLVDDPDALRAIFKNAHMLVAVHCEDEATIRRNLQIAEETYGEDIPMAEHPKIRSVEACFKSSSMALQLAKSYGTRLHILHLTTADELELFSNTRPLREKSITTEVCVHHLWFSADDYAQKGSLIKCNPAIKEKKHREGLWQALLNDKIDVVATDHAPHTWEEKQQKYAKAPSGLPLVQHPLLMMLEKVRDGLLDLPKLADKMAHSPAACFQIEDRGFIREGYWGDLVIVDPEGITPVERSSLFYKCGWSPLEGVVFNHRITHTIVSGQVAFENGKINEDCRGQRILFQRN